jgi:PAS domain-containing protein
MDHNGLTTGYVVMYRDITENKKAEYILKESENRFRTFFENIMDAVLLTIPDVTILTANPAAEKLFGYTEEEICKIGRNGLIDKEDPNLRGCQVVGCWGCFWCLVVHFCILSCK